MRQTEGSGLDGISVSDVDHVRCSNHEGFGQGAGRLFAHQMKSLCRGTVAGLSLRVEIVGGIHDDSTPDPGLIDPIPDRIDDADPVRTGHPRPGSLDAWNSHSDPDIKMIEACSLGSNSNLTRLGNGRRKFDDFHVRGHGGPAGHDGCCFHGANPTATPAGLSREHHSPPPDPDKDAVESPATILSFVHGGRPPSRPISAALARRPSLDLVPIDHHAHHARTVDDDLWL